MPPVNIHQSVRDILSHGAPLPAGANSPILHFELTTGDVERTLAYFERKTELSPSHSGIAGRHLGRLRQMALVSLIETLERFLKELASECIDVLAPLTADDRLDTFRVSGGAIAGHFGADTLGRALCESGTWLDCKSINDRFRDMLSDPSSSPPLLPPFQLFRQQPADERERYDTLQLVWQLRHTVVHNVGVVTQSDAVRLRVLSKQPVDPLRVIAPTRDDIRYLLRFLDETAVRCNARVAERLAEVLTRIHANDPTLFDPGERAGHLATQFRQTVTVAESTVSPPP
jgi:hypothetical protein